MKICVVRDHGCVNVWCSASCVACAAWIKSESIVNRNTPATTATVALLGVVFLTGGAIAALAALACAVFTLALMPLFRAYALARPNGRSSHRVPVPQGGGVPLVLVLCAGLLWTAGSAPPVFALVTALGLLALTGALDDIRPMAVVPRLSMQVLCVVLALWALPGDVRILPSHIPLLVERAVLAFGCLWFVNLTNFMDGIDGITIAAFVPLLVCVVLLAKGYPGVWLGQLSQGLAVFLLAGFTGFLAFNLPPAKLFLGDVGSLPIGLTISFILVDMAGHGAVAAAIILPLYHAVDATSTLLLRLFRRERVWDAHRQHAYQKAVDAGWSHLTVSGLVLMLNCVLAGLAFLSLRLEPLGQGFCLVLAVVLTVGLILMFQRREAAT
jgi:UDP-N-acetylmuramyl pentapeptide phosphotransferase/UDP-N-acetylglucosamine-1-phosphate transferase